MLLYLCMQNIFEKQILDKKSSIDLRQGFNTLVFFDGKISDCVNGVVYPANTPVFFVQNSKFDIFWGTKQKIVFDINDNLFHVGMSGEINIQIKNFRKFFEDVLNSKQKFDANDMHDLIVPVVANQLDIFLKKYIKQNNLDPTKIEVYKSEMSRVFRVEISQKLESMFGIVCNNFMTLNVLVDELELEKIKQKNIQILNQIQQSNFQKTKQQKMVQDQMTFDCSVKNSRKNFDTDKNIASNENIEFNESFETNSCEIENQMLLE